MITLVFLSLNLMLKNQVANLTYQRKNTELKVVEFKIVRDFSINLHWK